LEGDESRRLVAALRHAQQQAHAEFGHPALVSTFHRESGDASKLHRALGKQPRRQSVARFVRQAGEPDAAFGEADALGCTAPAHSATGRPSSFSRMCSVLNWTGSSPVVLYRPASNSARGQSLGHSLRNLRRLETVRNGEGHACDVALASRNPQGRRDLSRAVSAEPGARPCPQEPDPPRLPGRIDRRCHEQLVDLPLELARRDRSLDVSPGCALPDARSGKLVLKDREHDQIGVDRPWVGPGDSMGALACEMLMT